MSTDDEGRVKDPMGYDPRQLFSTLTPLDHDYERPSRPYRCGRERMWSKSCTIGPSGSGRCRGVYECAPHFKDGRHECRRAPRAGGPCANGPLPDGSCSLKRSPCVPVLNSRAIRDRIGALVAMAAVALIATFLAFGAESVAWMSSLNPGDLSGAHGRFTGEDGCSTCHPPHKFGSAEWLAAAFSANPPTKQCVTCHTFGGPAEAAHNTEFPDAEGAGASLTCVSCHTEHKGTAADIAGISDAQCNKCHKTRFVSFSDGHPAFDKTYPHQRKTTLNYDHVSHRRKHFSDPKMVEYAPKSCSGCHLVDEARRRVAPAGFDVACADCHGDQMAQREMVLMRLPEFEENLIDAAEIMDSCGPTLEQFELLQERLESYEAGDEPEEDEDDEEDFSGVGDDVDPLMAFLLQVDQDDIESYSEPAQTLIEELAIDGMAALSDRIGEATDAVPVAALLAGLNPELVKRAACAWAANVEYEAPEGAGFGGWLGDFAEIRYRPAGHGDPVVLAWIEYAIAAAAVADDDMIDQAIEFRDGLLDRKRGVGACTKCHAITDRGATDAETSGDGIDLAVQWTYHAQREGGHLKFNHAPHINLLGRDFGCKRCHAIDKDADFAAAFASHNPHNYLSNFLGIDVKTCTECHAAGLVRQDCLLCHEYHLEPRFKKQMTAQDE